MVALIVGSGINPKPVIPKKIEIAESIPIIVICLIDNLLFLSLFST